MEEECEYAFLHKDGASAHTARFSMLYVHEAFGEERTVSTGLWPPRSLDLSICDFYLWGNLKGEVYSKNPHRIEEWKTNIRNAIAEITQNELAKVAENMSKRPELCIQVHGEQFQHLL